jgi:hypothetical protein
MVIGSRRGESGRGCAVAAGARTRGLCRQAGPDGRRRLAMVSCPVAGRRSVPVG